MMPDDDNIMTLGEMADYLKIAKRSLLRMAQSGDIPGTKIASQWRFMRSVIDDWMISRMKSLPRGDLEKLAQTERLPFPLYRLLPVELVSLDIRPGSKRAVLEQLIELLERAAPVADRQGFLQKLLEREEMVSTAIFPGIALPHFRKPEENPLAEPRLVLGVCRQGTDFDSLDGRPTFALFLVCANNVVLHLKIIAELALLFRRPELIEHLRSAADARRALEALFPGMPKH
jgi:PTS system nitrogen regulatory IIA component